MLSKIFIQNFALIDSLEIDLKDGLQVITGETGAGKSIILGALRLILGERADIKSVNNSENKSVVEAEFVLTSDFESLFQDNDLDFETSTHIRREILPSGKSRAFVNDVPVTLDVLKTIAERLIDIHSQFETANLFNEAFQFKMIDGLAANAKALSDYQAQYAILKTAEADLQEAQRQLVEGLKEVDYKNFLLSELVEVDLPNVNWEDLQGKLQLQEHAETISDHLSDMFGRIDQEEVGLLDSLLEVRSKLSKVADLSHEFTEANGRFESLFVEFKDLLFELQNKAENIQVNPQELLVLQDKVNKINALFLKHNVGTVEELLVIAQDLEVQQEGFHGLEAKISEIQKVIENSLEKLEKLAATLSKNRKKGAQSFVKDMEGLLKKLGLEKAKLEVALTPTEKFNKFGKESVEILFQANSGFAMKPIQTAISGGERSRVMLAVKKIMSENAELPTLILDEIDTGVSGRIAEEMGFVMKEMSQNMQLIVITHLAQVAAKGDCNYKVMKYDVDGKTRSTIVPLSEEEKLTEIAALLSGSEITEAAISQAKSLMK